LTAEVAKSETGWSLFRSSLLFVAKNWITCYGGATSVDKGW